jgi:hypothetical protein
VRDKKERALAMTSATGRLATALPELLAVKIVEAFSAERALFNKSVFTDSRFVR